MYRQSEPVDSKPGKRTKPGWSEATSGEPDPLLRLIRDFIGSEFGSRHQQYEKFYGGASFLVKQNVFRNYDFKRATALVDQAPSLPAD